MTTSKWLKAMLILSGLIAMAIGGALLFVPVAFQASAGIVLGNNISLLSEVRAPGGALLASGVLIVTGAFVRRLAFTSIVLCASMYLSYGLSRLLSMAVDGRPSGSLLAATVAELVIGCFALFALMSHKEQVHA